MAIKEKIDFSTFTDRRSSKDLYANSVRKGLKYDAFGDQTKFQAIVISDPIPFSPQDLQFFTGDTGDLKEIWNNINNTTTQFSYRARIIGNNSPHSFLPHPCDSTYAADSEEALKIVAMHTLFVSNEEGGAANSVPRLGSKVEVELTKNVFGYNLQFGKHSKLVSNPEPSKASAEACDTLVSAMASATGGATSIGSLGAGTAIINLSNSLPQFSEEEGTIVGKSLDSLTSVVEKELSLWSGKKETVPEMYATLEKYWSNLGVTDWTPAGVPWSAAFISWVVGQADSSFPKSAGHYFYSEAANKGVGGWTAWSVKNPKIKAQIGDILVRPRTGAGASNTSSHGDVVYKIQDGKALLAGGNLGNTARIEARLSIDSEGNYTDFSKYIVVLKKNGTIKTEAVS
jgi:hypothetical protein